LVTAAATSRLAFAAHGANAPRRRHGGDATTTPAEPNYSGTGGAERHYRGQDAHMHCLRAA